MPQTKTTPRLPELKCPRCSSATTSKQAITKHVIECGRDVEKSIACNQCSFRTIKNYYLNRHIKKHHGQQNEQTEDSSAETGDTPVDVDDIPEVFVESDKDGDSDWGREDPGDFIKDHHDSSSGSDKEASVHEVPSSSTEQQSPLTVKEELAKDCGDVVPVIGRIIRKPTRPDRVVSSVPQRSAVGAQTDPFVYRR
ncbi:uncharacterized protein LOC132548696 [Ylistrum balloti]|uniref:uncharacterized protein LOC132548696 n=1 Tax=Ylistrum balloti TaxID=509963 RepID=UPI002905F16C|nr:uncharacterized protein LOC132548696 [Ylistrum balloti]